MDVKSGPRKQDPRNPWDSSIPFLKEATEKVGKWQTLMARFGSTFTWDFEDEEDEDEEEEEEDEMKEKLGGLVVHLNVTWREMLRLRSD